jgi:nucleotide-binding universal stress UspA family protein
MYRTILVALDGSPLGERALPYAAAVARATGDRLRLVRVVPGRTDADDAAADYLQRAAARLARPAPGTAVLAGDPATEILREARRAEAGLVALSTHGRSGLGRWLYGSVADALLRQADLPVLLVPAACPPAWPPEGPRRVVIPLDGSPFAEAAIGPGADLAEALCVEVVVLRVVGPPPHVVDDALGGAHVVDDPAAALEEARRYVAAVADGLRRRGRAAERLAAVGPPAATIAAAAAERGAGVVAMATHGRGGVERAVLGSVTTETIRRSAVPLLLVRPGAGRERRPQGDTEVNDVDPDRDRDC